MPLQEEHLLSLPFFCTTRRLGGRTDSWLLYIQSEYSVPSNLLMENSLAQPIEAPCAGLLSRAWYEITALPQCTAVH
jgi:hypothetical protein